MVAFYAGVAFTLGSVMPAQTVSVRSTPTVPCVPFFLTHSQALFRTYYGWNSAHTGVALSVSTTWAALPSGTVTCGSNDYSPSAVEDAVNAGVNDMNSGYYPGKPYSLI